VARTTRQEARARLVRAAWEAADEAGIEQVLGGVSLRDVARRAGVAPSTVTYHFTDAADLARAMVGWLLDSDDQVPLEPLGSVTGDPALGGADTVRSATDLAWAMAASEEGRRFHRRLLRLVAATGSPRDGEDVRRAVDAKFAGEVVPALQDLYEQGAARLGLRWLEPLGAADVARLVVALIDGLTVQLLIEPGSVRPDLTTDAVVALLASVTAPEAERRALAELEARIDVALGHEDDGVADDPVRLRSIARDATPLFAPDRGPVTWTEVALTTGVPVREVVASFGSLQRLAAVSFHQHLGAVEEAGRRRRDTDGRVALADLLCELVRAGRAAPVPVRALVCERIAVPDPSVTVGTDLSSLVPLDALVAEAIRSVAGAPADADDLAPVLVDLVLSRALARPRDSPASVAALALRLLPLEPGGPPPDPAGSAS
jgi:AcrR family transcriptional regulator